MEFVYFFMQVNLFLFLLFLRTVHYFIMVFCVFLFIFFAKSLLT